MIPFSALNQNTSNLLTVHPSNSRIIDCDLRGLDQDQIVAFIANIAAHDKNAAFVDASPMATGKTLLACALTRTMQHESFVAIAHRVSLVYGLGSKFGFPHYQDVTPQEFLKNLAVCLNSIRKLKVSERFNHSIIDEFRQTLEGMLLSKTIDNKREILAEFKALLNNSEFLMCLDADFNDFCLEFLLEHTTKTIYRIHRSYELPQKEIIELKDHATIRKLCVQNYYNSLNTLLSVSTVKDAQRTIRCLVERGVREDEILDITAGNKKDPRVKAFYANPNEEIKKYRFLIYTPCITSGVSVVEAYFDRHYAMFSQVLQSNENLQMIARDRTAKTVYCSFSKNKSSKLSTNLAKLIDGSILQRMRLIENKKLEVELDELEALQLKLIIQYNEDLNDYRINFFNHALKNGYNVTSYDPNADTTPDDPLQEGLNERVLAHQINTILHSTLIDGVEAKRIHSASETTYDETNSLHRFNTTLMRGSEDILEFDVERYLKGDFKVIKRHESLTANKHTLIEKDRIQWANNGYFVSDTGVSAIANEVLDLLKGKTITKELACQAIEVLARNSNELIANGFTDYSDKVNSERPIQTVRNFIAKFGYQLEFLKQLRQGNKRERVYGLSMNPYIAECVERRKLAGLSARNNSDDSVFKNNHCSIVPNENPNDLSDKITDIIMTKSSPPIVFDSVT
jgi:hypothetical protein